MPSKKSSANRALARVIRSTRERRGYSQEGFARSVLATVTTCAIEAHAHTLAAGRNL